ncbi:glycosyl transferase [Mangrovactinospora gilvigrisea]|uniref:Glycosyl transferase n=1 Tax=Mangrovactinospora gilvigrisea TaxID=1428644 RepID=A0A1J7C4C0_9ACTN|nr:glycosyl transferase [Mangrovactinospora gilvigrisea]
MIPVFEVQGYIRPCLESVLGQRYPSADRLQVIAVDDRSPDGSGAILDEVAARDPRLTVLHLGENVGLGRARNAGLEQAHGDYVLFLDSDDLLAPGALAALEARLAETDAPDIVIFDYLRLHWDGRRTPNRRADVLSGAPSGAFRPADHPELLELLPVAWNKAYRRDFLTEHGFRFPSGYYEDAPWTYPILMAAERAAVLNRVCVLYRQRRQGGNILRTVSHRHFDVFDQYERIFDFLDGMPDQEAARSWRALLFPRMASHYTTILDHPSRLPDAARPDFFRRAAADYRARLPEGPRTARAVGRKEALLARGGTLGWRGYSALRRAARAKAAALRRGRRTAARAARALLRAYYRVQRLMPLDPGLVLFSSYWDRAPSCSPAALDAELALLAPEFRRLWVVHPSHAKNVPAGTRTVAPGSRAYWRAMARAAFVISNVNLANRVVKRPGQVHVQTHHGTPLKVMGIDQLDYPSSRQPGDPAQLMARCDRWDWSISSNPHSTEVWARVYPGRFRTLESGYPRNDVFYRSGAEDVLRARRRIGVPDGALAVLYAPTHRDWERGYRPHLDLDRFLAATPENVVVLVRAHYFHDAEGAGSLPASPRVYDVSRHPSVEQLCLAADCLATDYSSLMFDYANLDRPIVCLLDDWETYRTVRGTYFSLPDEPPGHVARGTDELAALFAAGRWDDAESAVLRAAFRRRFCAFDDGRAAERVIRAVLLNEPDPDPIVPLDLRRPAPAPREALAGRRPEGSVPHPASGTRAATR